MLIADELAVLLTREKGGMRTTGLDVADTLAGGLLAELALEKQVSGDVDPEDFWGRRRVRQDSAEPPADPRLARTWELITSPSVGAVQRAVAKQAREIVLPALAEQEVLSVTPRVLIGPRYALLDESLRTRLQDEFVPIVLEGAPADERQRAIIWLLHGANCLRQALGLELREWVTIQRHVRALGKPTWPAKAAIDAMVGRRAAAVS